MQIDPDAFGNPIATISESTIDVSQLAESAYRGIAITIGGTIMPHWEHIGAAEREQVIQVVVASLRATLSPRP